MMPQLEENSQAFRDGDTNLKQHVHKMDTTPTRAKPEDLPAAEVHFQNTGIAQYVTAQGQRHLGPAIDSRNFVEYFV